MTPERRFGLRRVLLFGTAALCLLAAPAFAQEYKAVRVEFKNDLSLSSKEGHVSLKWASDRESEMLVYELQTATDAGFSEPLQLYEGGDDALFMSGLEEGRYFFRVRGRHIDNDAWGPWSPSVELVCDHHSFVLMWTLFASGGLMFVLIVSFIVVNARSLDRFENLESPDENESSHAGR